mgnify:CR=1 FL=1
MDDFPVPIRFDLPAPQWRAVARDFGGIRNALFEALRDDTEGGYTPVLSFSGGWRTDDATMEQIADECVMRLREETGDARLLDRRAAGTAQSPGYSQIIRSVAQIDGTEYVLARLQAVLGLVDPAQPKRRAVLVVSCTSTGEQAKALAPEFEALVKSLRVDESRRAG